ncbi:MAG: hypothetical protein ABI649_08670 [Gaiellaceae bacterium]
MPQKDSSRWVLLRLVLFTLAGWALWALGRDDAKPGSAAAETATDVTPGATPKRSGGFSKRRLATSLAFATLFFAGAAFSAGAGDLVVSAIEGSSEPAVESTTGDTTTEASEPAPADEPVPAEEPTDPAPSDPPADDGATDGSGGGAPADEPVDPAGEPSDDGAAPAPGAEDGSSDPASGNDGSGDGSEGSGQPDAPAAGPGSPASAGDPAPAPEVPANPSPADLASARDADLEAEQGEGFATVWLNRNLPDPTPPAKRLDSGFAKRLAKTARANGVDWALVLGVVRARGHLGRVPATQRTLESLSANLRNLHASKDAWQAVLNLSGRTAFADRAVALARYNRAVGLNSLVRGLVASKADLQARLLVDSRVSVYAGGRSDVAAGKVNVRVLATILYLAEAHGQVAVSSLFSGHRLYSRPGVVSAHIYGLAVDIAALEGRSITGNQEPGGLTERAVRNILLLPAELQPKQVISLLGLGGASFPLADHNDHIHIGF